ncbi:MAG: GNAT family N-acetyltransferase [Bacteroidales bacterium]
MNDYEAVFPLAVNSKFNIHYIYQPFFTRYFGIFSKSVVDVRIVNNFLNAIPERIKFIEFNIHESNPIERTDFQKQERFFQILDITKTYEEISADYKGDARRNLKKASKVNLSIVDRLAPEKTVALFKQNKGKQLKELHEIDYLRLQNLMYAAINHDCGISLGAFNSENDLIAAAFFIISKQRILFLKGSANTEGKKSGAMYLLIDTMLKKYAQKVDIFDFGGSSVENIASFNHNFGAKNCLYLQVKKNNLSLIIKQLSGKK